MRRWPPHGLPPAERAKSPLGDERAPLHSCIETRHALGPYSPRPLQAPGPQDKWAAGTRCPWPLGCASPTLDSSATLWPPGGVYSSMDRSRQQEVPDVPTMTVRWPADLAPSTPFWSTQSKNLGARCTVARCPAGGTRRAGPSTANVRRRCLPPL